MGSTGLTERKFAKGIENRKANEMPYLRQQIGIDINSEALKAECLNLQNFRELRLDEPLQYGSFAPEGDQTRGPTGQGDQRYLGSQSFT